MTQNRLKQGATYELEPLEFADPLKAIVRLIQTELNYGGVIVDIDERSITVRTIVMEDVDTSIFEGSPESMKPMLQFVRYFMDTKKYKRRIEAKAFKTVKEYVPGNMLPFVTMDFQMIIGTERVKAALMMVYGLGEEEILAGLERKIKDVVAAIQLRNEGCCSFIEALAI